MSDYHMNHVKRLSRSELELKIKIQEETIENLTNHLHVLAELVIELQQKEQPDANDSLRETLELPDGAHIKLSAKTLRRVRLTALRTLLNDAGWVDRQLGWMQKHQNGHPPIDVDLPGRQSYRDYALRLAEAVSVIASVEGWPTTLRLLHQSMQAEEESNFSDSSYTTLMDTVEDQIEILRSRRRWLSGEQDQEYGAYEATLQEIGDYPEPDEERWDLSDDVR